MDIVNDAAFSSDPLIRIAAAHTLGLVDGGKEAVLLQKLPGDPVEEVREAVTETAVCKEEVEK